MNSIYIFPEVGLTDLLKLIKHNATIAAFNSQLHARVRGRERESAGQLVIYHTSTRFLPYI